MSLEQNQGSDGKVAWTQSGFCIMCLESESDDENTEEEEAQNHGDGDVRMLASWMPAEAP